MDLTHCPYCESDQLAYGTIADGLHTAFQMGMFKRVPVYGAACLACGAVVSYLDDAALAKVRKWSGKAKPVKATVDEL
jgi:hypothetical protein